MHSQSGRGANRTRALRWTASVVLGIAMLSVWARLGIAQPAATQPVSASGHDSSIPLSAGAPEAMPPDSMPPEAMAHPAMPDDATHAAAMAGMSRPALAAAAAPIAPDNPDFVRQVDLQPLATLSIQHNQVLKTLDTFARQMLSGICGSASLDGHDALYSVLDLSLRPERYATRNIIRIANVPLRQDFRLLDSLDEQEQDRIVHTGMVSPQFLGRPDVQDLLQRAQAQAAFKANAIEQIVGAVSAVDALSRPDMPLLRIIAPSTFDTRRDAWHTWYDAVGNAPALRQWLSQMGGMAPQPLPGYNAEQNRMIERAAVAVIALREAWRAQDAAGVNTQVSKLAAVLPQINPAIYPSSAKRHVEVLYNRLAKLTLPGAALYFVAFVLMLMAAQAGGVRRMWRWGMGLFLAGFAVHTLGIAIRWWLVQTSAGSWFEAIPIKNQFESVLFSAWFGCAVGLGLEWWRRGGIFGAAASFVGWLSLVAIYATPYVTGREIGGEIGQVSGVLMSYWLYIHVTMVTASYALIGMGFLLSLWWLVRYYRSSGGPDDRIAPGLGGFGERRISARGIGSSTGAPAARSDWADSGDSSSEFGAAVATTAPPVVLAEVPIDRGSFLRTLDTCNLVVLQLAFWILGMGIVMGAIWADQSWGRPWGWDPKETFALVTWIVYLIVVHVRIATRDKAWWTAVLGVIGFFIMLFNWIGVNFFLVGLHSYA